jgi:hypothetical protein
MTLIAAAAFAVVLAVAVIAVLVARYLYRETRQLRRQNAALSWQVPIRRTAEEQQDERLFAQLEAVTRETVTFSASRVMGRGEFDLFRAALGVTRQPFPTDRYGNPVAVLEYQGAGHDIGGTATRRDQIKQVALKRAGVRYVEIRDGATQAEIQETIRALLTLAANAPATIKGR